MDLKSLRCKTQALEDDSGAFSFVKITTYILREEQIGSSLFFFQLSCRREAVYIRKVGGYI